MSRFRSQLTLTNLPTKSQLPHWPISSCEAYGLTLIFRAMSTLWLKNPVVLTSSHNFFHTVLLSNGQTCASCASVRRNPSRLDAGLLRNTPQFKQQRQYAIVKDYEGRENMDDLPWPKLAHP